METLTVKQLIEKLQQLDGDLPVFTVDTYNVCFAVAEVGTAEIEEDYDDSVLSDAVGILRKSNADYPIVYIGCCEGHNL